MSSPRSTPSDCTGDTEIKFALEVVGNRLARVIRGSIGKPALKAGMSMRANDGRHHRFAGEIDAGAAGRKHNRALASYGGNHAAGAQDRRIIDCRAAVAANDARPFEQHTLRLRGTKRGHEEK